MFKLLSRISSRVKEKDRLPETSEEFFTRSFFSVLNTRNRALFNLFLSRGADVNTPLKGGLTPLVHSIQRHNRIALSFLMEQGADINQPDQGGWTPLMWAVKEKQWLMVRILTEGGADLREAPRLPDLAARKGAPQELFLFLFERGIPVTETTFETALTEDLAAPVLRLLYEKHLEAGYDSPLSPFLHSVLFNKPDECKHCLSSACEKSSLIVKMLNWSASLGHQEIFKLLWRAASEQKLSFSSSSLLKTAAARGQTGIIKLLLEKTGNTGGCVPLFHALERDSRELASLLMEDRFKESCDSVLNYALVKSTPAMLKFLLEKGLSFKEKLIPPDILKNPWCRELLEELLSLGFNLNTPCDGRTLIQYAGFSFVGRELLQWLLDKGADPCIFTTPSHNPVALAITHSQDAGKVRDLLDRGGIVDGYTFATGILSASREILRLLVENGADLTTLYRGKNMLNYGASLGYEHIAEYLLSKGMNINHQGDDGETALMAAVKSCRPEVTEFLLRRGADMSLRNSEGLTALDLARIGGFHLIVEVFEMYR